jgi:uncharacterized protein (TIGR03000 family)
VKKFLSFAVLGVTAAALTLATPGVSSAGGHYGHGHYRGHGYRGYHHRPYDYWRHYRWTTRYYCPAPVYCAPAAPLCSNVARVQMCVPAEARIWIDGQETSQSGTERLFESPPLTPGQTYTYCITARWCGPDGKDVTVKRDVDVQANGTVRVNLMGAAS